MTFSFDVNEWIRYAQMDYDAAKNMSALHRPVPMEIVCYHCQQSAEKVLKAYAIAKEEPLIKTHDLETILTQCLKHDKEFDALSGACTYLTDYATFSRYPIREDSVTEHDMNEALRYSAEVLDFTKAKLAELDAESEQK